MSDQAEQHLRLVEPPAAPVDPLIGQTIDGRYEIAQKLGEGGMGVVYKAKHVVLQKDLAIKVLRADVSKDQEIITRFRQEAQSASAIGSQHIIDISDFGQLPDGSTYFIMEFLGGKELTKVIEKEQPIPTERLVRVAKQLCDALGAAHDAGIVHRDMKPDNVFLIKRGGTTDFVKVLDFGIAKVGGASSKLTRAGQVFGTPHYMSPEQCSGQGVDHRTDIYAIGVILYEMACGKVPFDADNLMGILTKHIYEQPIPLHQLPPPTNVPAGLEAVILKCLAKSVDHRYQTMAEVKADLEAFEAGVTPGAVMDGLDRGAQPRRDPTGRQSALQVGVGGTYEESRGGGGSKLPLILGALVGLLSLAGLAITAFFVINGSGEPEITAEPIIETPPEPEPEPEPEVVPEVAAEMAQEPAPEQVRLSIVSEPSGVEVWMGEEGQEVLLGNTPFELPRPERGERVRLTLKQPGFDDHPVSVSYLTQPEVRVTLNAERAGRRGGSRSGGSRSGGAAQQAAQQQAAQQAAQQQAAQQQAQQQQQPQETPQGRGGSGTVGREVLDPWAN